ncbi:hypothetical protein [Lactobacillus helveticus]|nr:hypothetical protein [Lactobacillus helveticus]
MQYGAESLFGTDDHYIFNNKGAATIKVDQRLRLALLKSRGALSGLMVSK